MIIQAVSRVEGVFGPWSSICCMSLSPRLGQAYPSITGGKGRERMIRKDSYSPLPPLVGGPEGQLPTTTSPPCGGSGRTVTHHSPLVGGPEGQLNTIY